jgi:hypothetical protein
MAGQEYKTQILIGQTARSIITVDIGRGNWTAARGNTCRHRVKKVVGKCIELVAKNFKDPMKIT